jgi:hypothetical protein
VTAAVMAKARMKVSHKLITSAGSSQALSATDENNVSNGSRAPAAFPACA